MFKPVATSNAPSAVGPYSQGIVTEQFVFCSGQTPMHPQTKVMRSDDIAEETRQALENVKAVLEAAGSGMSKVVKTTVFLTNMDDFATVNEIYKQYFTEPYPARSCVAVAALPVGARVEVEAIAAK